MKQHFLKRYPELPFVALAYLFIAVLVALLRNAAVPFEPLLIVGSWTPNIAAFIVLGLVLRERGGIRRLLGGWAKWRVGIRWYGAALSPLLIALLTAGVFRAMGRIPIEPMQPVGLQLLSSLLLSIVTGAMGEELGWRGFLLARLQQRFNALTSSLIVGLIWALWHLPLWSLPGLGWDAIPYWAFALIAVSSSVLFTFILNNAAGSLLLASITHLSINFGMGAVGILGWLPSPREGWVIAAAIYAVAAIVISMVFGPARLSRKDVSVVPVAATTAARP